MQTVYTALRRWMVWNDGEPPEPPETIDKRMPGNHRVGITTVCPHELYISTACDHQADIWTT